METDYSAWKFWLDLAQWVVTLGVAVIVWIDRGRKDNKAEIKTLTDSQLALERRLTAAEESLRHAPTHEDIVRLSTQNAALESKLDRVTNTLDRIHDYLMARK